MSVAPAPPTTSRPDLASWYFTEVDRALKRTFKGVDYVSSPGPEVGKTPKQEIYQRGTLRLYHYEARTDEVYRVPVLLVMATTNRSYIFDLAPGQSMVEYLLEAGFDVFVIDWEPPLPEERGLRLEDYTQDFIPACVRKVQESTGEIDVSIIGYCMGGVLSLIYAATHNQGPLKNLVCLTTPVDWQQQGLFTVWQDRRYFDVDRLVDTYGVVPAELVHQGFEMQRPASRLAGELRVWDQMWNDDFVKSHRAFGRWGDETLPLAGEYLRQTVKELSWENKLITGKLMVGDKSADLSNISVPLLSVVAEHDHLVPYNCSKPLLELVSSVDKEEALFKGGHVSVIAGPRAAKRMWPKVEDWLSPRSV